MILVYGDINLDILVQADGPKQYGSDVTGQIALRGGGSAANFAAWTSFLGERTTFIGRIGNDPAGLYLKENLQYWGVNSALEIDQHRPTGKILLFIDVRGERTMITERGTNLFLSAAQLAGVNWQGVSHIHITGYSLFASTILVETTLKALELARELGLSVSVDPSSYALLKEFGPERFFRIAADAELFFPNLDEGMALTGLIEPEAIVTNLLPYYKIVVLKLGPAGCLIGRPGQLTRVANRQIIENPDTTGAGDAFAAAFVCQYLKDRNNLLKAGQEANRVARQCLQIKGGRPPFKNNQSEDK